MDIFFNISSLVIPLFLLGLFAAIKLKIDRQSIAHLLFYIVVPIIFFDVDRSVILEIKYFILPVIFFITSAVMCQIYLVVSSRIFADARANIIAFSAGSVNSGYFGLPIAMLLFEKHWVAIYMLSNIGLSIYDYTIGAYVMAKGNLSSKQALLSVIKLPMIYAFILGLALNQFDITIPVPIMTLVSHMKSCYVVLGIMLIGINIGGVNELKIDWKFISLFLSSKFIAVPIVIFTLIKIDQNYLHIFINYIEAYNVMTLLSILPPAVNTVVFATINRIYPQQTATAVILGTLIALIYVPLMIQFMIK